MPEMTENETPMKKQHRKKNRETHNAAGIVSFSGSSTPESRLSLIRRGQRMQEYMFTKIMNASGTTDAELRTGRISPEKLDTDMESRKASNEREHAAQDEMLWIMRDQADMLRRWVELQEQKQEGRVPLQMLVDSQPASPGAESPSHKHSMRCGRKVHYPFHLTRGRGRVQGAEGAYSQTFHGLDCGVMLHR
nr:basic helix-loop-helix domain-containing protein USF3 isoform X3 [Caretta caretta]